MYLNKRNKYYYVWYKDEQGKTVKVSTKTTKKSEALEFLKSFMGNREIRLTKPQTVHLSSFTAEYLQYSQIHHTYKTTRTCKSALRELLRIEGDLILSEIDSRVMDHFLGIKSNTCTIHTVGKFYRTLRSIFEQAKKWKYITENPLSLTPKPKTPSVELKYFTKDDFSKLISVIPDSSIIKPMAYFAIYTGCRLAEVVNAEWKYVDFERKVYIITCNNRFQTKSKRSRVLPLSNQLYEMLLKMKKSDLHMNYIFLKPDGTKYTEEYVSHKFKKYCNKAGLNDLNYHCLRKSFGCWLLLSDVPIYTISKLLGHSSVNVTTAHYTTLNTEKLHDVVNKLSFDEPDKNPLIENSNKKAPGKTP